MFVIHESDAHEGDVRVTLETGSLVQAQTDRCLIVELLRWAYENHEAVVSNLAVDHYSHEG